MYNPNSINCPKCGTPTGLVNPFLMVIPPEGLHCYSCGALVIQGSNIKLWPKPLVDKEHENKIWM